MKVIQYMIVLLVACLGSCKKTTYSPAELVQVVDGKETAFTSSKTVDDVTVSVSYLPPAYNTLSEMEGSMSDKMYEKTHRDYAGSCTFRLQLNHNSGQHPFKAGLTYKDESFMRKKYADFDITKDVWLTRGKDTIDCAMHHHFYSDMRPEMELLFLFDREKLNKSKGEVVFCYNDRLFNKGQLLFAFDEETINFDPKIKF